MEGIFTFTLVLIDDGQLPLENEFTFGVVVIGKEVDEGIKSALGDWEMVDTSKLFTADIEEISATG